MLAAKRRSLSRSSGTVRRARWLWHFKANSPASSTWPNAATCRTNPRKYRLSLLDHALLRGSLQGTSRPIASQLCGHRAVDESALVSLTEASSHASTTTSLHRFNERAALVLAC